MARNQGFLSVFPALAGVILLRFSDMAFISCIPRTSGGDPLLSLLLLAYVVYSPH